jgi:hypothetical protein
MRVLHLDSGREMRGGQWQVLYLAVGQKTAGLDPLLLTPRGSPLSAMAEERGVPCGVLSLPAIWRESRRAAVTHAHDARSHTLGAIAAQAPLVVSRRVGFPIRTGALSRWKYSRAARYLAISEYVAGQLRLAGVGDERIAVVYDGVPVFPAAAHGIGERLVTPYWEDARKAGGLAEQAAAQAGVALHVSRDLEADLPQARALLYLSDLEGLGSAALLAQSYGVPVIASRAGGLPEAVLDERTGLIVDNTVDSVTAAIRRLFSDRALALSMGARGRERIQDQFTLAHLMLRTLHHYKQVVL